MSCYQLLDLPHVPHKYIDIAWEYYRDTTKNEIINNFPTTLKGHGRELFNDGRVIGQSSANLRKKFSDEFEGWVHDNITPEFNDTGINYTAAGMNHSGPHTDISRKYTLIYLLQSGGPDATTVFYREKNPDAKRVGNHYQDYADLEIIDSIKIPLNTWCIIDSTVIHSVENISEGRIGIQVSLNTNPWQLNFDT